ncbi:MAG: hypothetical protein K8F93_15050, partial [Burkholderiales bacterium]|nr:hypothetical protein [Burkholderiales bacterium]
SAFSSIATTVTRSATRSRGMSRCQPSKTRLRNRSSAGGEAARARDAAASSAIAATRNAP